MGDIEPGRVIAGKYRVERRLSHGGMGSVWLAHHLHLDAPVALKFMRPSLVQDASARARFEREAKAAAQIRSPHVVHMYDHGIDGGVPFIVMEFLEGEDLRSRLKGRRRLDTAQAIRICNEVSKGLERAHGLGIVHRDLKPGNIFLSVPDDDMVKILDFGIAKETGENRVVRGDTTTTGQLLGSPHYLSPEQARGHELDGRSDLWSLAVILFRALTGRRPFDGTDIGDLIVRICTDPVPRVSSLRPDLGSAIDAFFDRAFQRDPALRFQTAKELASAFSQALSGAEASWESREAGEPAWDDAPTAVTPSLTPASSAGSSRFGNVAVGGMTPDDERASLPTQHPDTFAATTAPATSRRALVGGAVVAAAAGGVLALFVLLSRGDDAVEATQPASADSVAAAPATAPASPAPHDPPRTLATASASARADLSTETKAEPETTAAADPPPPAPRVAKPAPPSRPRPAVAPAPPPPSKPKVDLGY